MSIELRNITKSFGAFRALKDVSIHVETGELLALLGPSGSGKTTLLRIIAGLETADSEAGGVLLHGEDVTARRAGTRKVGFVFQHYALFRHVTVFENVAFGLRVRPWRERPAGAEIARRVADLLRLVQLDGLAGRYPSQLSGGQRQRVALARALAVEPKVLLLDEPFGALDARVRRELRRWLRRLHDQVPITTVFVTHDQEEALEVADRVAVMNEGTIEQLGTPQDVYDHPATPFVLGFLGHVNRFAALTPEATRQAAGDATPTDPDRIVYVRPHDVEIVRTRDSGDAGPDATLISARVDEMRFAGDCIHVRLTRRDTGDPIEAAVPRDRYGELELKRGEVINVKLRNARVFTDSNDE